MAGKLSTYLRNALTTAATGGAPFTPPTNLYLGIFTTDPTKDNVGIEFTGGSYARQLLTWSAVADGLRANNALIRFGPSSAAWGLAGWFGVFDALTGGNLYWFDVAPKKGSPGVYVTVGAGENLLIDIGDIVVGLQ